VSGQRGQAIRCRVAAALHLTGRTAHRLAQVAIALVVLVAVAGVGLAWRLAQGPLEIDWLTHRLEAMANADGRPPALVIRSAALAWEGFSRGVDQPLDIRLEGVALLNAAGKPIAEIPRSEVSLAPAWLLLRRLMPRTLEMEGIRLRARRDADGRTSVDFGRPADDAGGPAAGHGVLPALLRGLAQPAGNAGGRVRPFWSELRRVLIRDAALVVDDHQLGATWQASQVQFDVARSTRGGAEATAEMTLALGDQRVQATARASLASGGDFAAVQAQLSPISPSRLAQLAPGLAALRVVQAPVTLAATAMVNADLVPRELKLQASIGEGHLLVGAGSVPVAGGLVTVAGSLDAATLKVERLELSPGPGRPSTTLRGSIETTRAHGRLNATITGELDQVAFADLAALWPVGVGGPGTRPWVTENITDGVARNGSFEVHLTANEDLSDATLTSITGGIDGRDLTVHWLRPVPPLEHGNARLNFLSPDALEIVVTGGVQSGGGLVVRSGRVLITGLSERDQFMTIDADLAGPVADLLGVLKHPRLGLLDRWPLEMRDPAGTVAGRVVIKRLPLEFDVTLDDVRIQCAGKLSGVHLGGIAAGRDLDQGMADFEAGNDGLALHGSAALAGIASQLEVNLDFRDGGPRQVLQKVSASGTATASQLEAAGLDTAGLLEGPAALRLTWQTRRDASGEVAVQGDLAGAVLQLPRLNFRKPAGQPATASALVRLDHDRIIGIDRVRIDGAGIAVAGRVAFAGGRPESVPLDRLRLGEATDASGEVRPPARPGDPWVVALSGRSLDASAEFGRNETTRKTAPEDNRAEPAWRADVRFDRVVLGKEGRVLTGVAGTAESDGRIIHRGRLTGETGSGGAFRLEITPEEGGRTLAASAADAGRLLYALGLVQSMRGGRLTIHGSYDDRAAGHPLQGTAEILDFRIRNAPALAKLLQAMTLYGLVEAVQGPGLGFNHLIAPFRLSGDVLELSDARAFSASLGMTAKGRLDLARDTIEMEGTIVPAYFFNTLLGEIPLIGRLFSPERGGGVFAATYSLHGPLDDPSVGVNPLAALTPGFLRGIFGIFDRSPNGGAPQAQSAPQQNGSGN
jgi:hypothetical protein